MRRWLGTLRFQLTASFLAVAVVPTLVAGALAGWVAVVSVRESISARNLQVARAVGGEISGFLEGQLWHLRAVALGYAQGQARADFERQAALHLGAGGGLQSLVLLDRQARVVAVTPADRDLEGIDFSAQPFVVEAQERRVPTWSSATISLHSGRPVVAVVYPGNGFMVVGYLELGAALTSIVEKTRVGPAGRAAIIDRNGTILAHPDERLVLQQVNIRDIALVERALAGQEATAEYAFEGQRLLGSVAQVPQTRWVVLASEPAETALEPVARLRALVLLMVGLAALAALVAGVLSARRILRPLAQLSAETRRLAAGEGAPPELQRQPAPWELRELAESFHRMATAVWARERELRASEERFRTMSSMGAEGVMVHEGGVILDANLAFARLVGVEAPAQLIGRNGFEVLPLTPASLQLVRQHAGAGSEATYEIELRRPDGGVMAAETTGSGIVFRGRPARLVTLRDVSARKALEAERTRLEASLRQAQKMESIGRLAGGVAHDFNNLLTVIIGNATLALPELPPGSTRDLLADVKTAGQSAARLTRQLLAFSRKQVIEPRVLALPEVIPGLQSMLRRLLGEDVELQVVLEDGLGRVRIDPGQLEQILVNLAVNARDAMPKGGKLTIEAGNVALDEESCRRHGTLQPGRFVRLAVSDNGTGMSEEARAHLFEPFFTTKAPGEGTGLGLPMVYGAVSQNGGSVEVYTELGHGTTFRIYLPLVDQPVEAPAPVVQAKVSGGAETILLVEDHELVRGFAVRLLRRKGYRVHPFANGQEALQALAALPGRPDLLITDVVMPGINGKALAESVRAACPGVRILFTSGFTANVIVHHGVLERGVEFLPKPYSAEELLRRVREVMEAARG